MELKKQSSYLNEFLLKCPICYESFSSLHKPLIIPCGHTMCSFCVKNLKKIGEEEYDEDFNSNNSEFDISLDSQSDEEEINNNEEEEEEEVEEEEEESEDDDDMEEEEIGDDINNAFENEEINYPDIQGLLNDACGGNNQVNQPNQANQTNPANIKKDKFKIKCSICRNKMKILDSDIIVNQNVINVIKSVESDGNNKSDSISENKAKRIFCKKCRFVDNEVTHKINFSDHEKNMIVLDDSNSMLLDRLKRMLGKYEKESNYDKNQDKDMDIDMDIDDHHNSLMKCIISNCNYETSILNRIHTLLYKFITNLFNSPQYRIDAKLNISNYFKINAKAMYLKHKSFAKLTKLYMQYKEIVSKIPEKETENSNNSNNSNDNYVQKAEECLDNSERLLSKYSKLNEIYLNNYKKLFNFSDDSLGEKETSQKEEEDDINLNLNITNLSKYLSQLITQKTILILKHSFFATFHNNLFSSEKRYSIAVDTSNNKIEMLDLRLDTPLEIEFEKIFEDFDSNEEDDEDNSNSNSSKEKYFTSHIVLDDNERYLYLLGKRNSSSKKFRRYDLIERKTDTLENIPMRLDYFNTYFTDGKLWLFGGVEEEVPVLKCCYYSNYKWVNVKSLQLLRSYQSIAFNNGRFYIFGGKADENNELSYKFETNTIEGLKKNQKWKIFNVIGYSFTLYNMMHSFIDEDLLIIFCGEDYVSYEDSEIGYKIKLNVNNFAESHVVEQVKYKLGTKNWYSACASYRGLCVGTIEGEGYFNKMKHSI